MASASASRPCAWIPSGAVFPADETPLALPPPDRDTLSELWTRWCADRDEDDQPCWDAAMPLAWAIGRPESLTEAVTRLGRQSGRGRRRRIRDLGDSLGLCGIWG